MCDIVGLKLVLFFVFDYVVMIIVELGLGGFGKVVVEWWCVFVGDVVKLVKVEVVEGLVDVILVWVVVVEGWMSLDVGVVVCV